jgi:hypothetical protein
VTDEATPRVPGFQVYLGARYSRRLELWRYAGELGRAGLRVTSRWLDGEYGDLVGKTGSTERDAEAQAAAEHDWADIHLADTVVIFTDPPEYVSKNGRGGFHVEFGIAMALGKRIVLVGHRVNSFHHLEAVHFYTTWEHAARAEFGIGDV